MNQETPNNTLALFRKSHYFYLKGAFSQRARQLQLEDLIAKHQAVVAEGLEDQLTEQETRNVQVAKFYFQ